MMIRHSVFAAILLAAGLCLGLAALVKPVYATGDGDVLSAGEPGEPAKSARVVSVTTRDADGKLVFDPAFVKVQLGEQIRFVVTNAGQLDHEFFLGNADEVSEHGGMMRTMPEMEHSGANVLRLKPGETKELVWHFTKPGDFEYVCLLPGHLEAGMVGKLDVE